MKVLDKGFVELIDHMGSDLSVVNGARISMGKRKEVFDEKDAGLINYLAEHGHFSPFRHCHITFHIKAPIFVIDIPDVDVKTLMTNSTGFPPESVRNGLMVPYALRRPMVADLIPQELS